MRNEESVKQKKGRRTDLMRHTISLDKSTTMNERYAIQTVLEVLLPLSVMVKMKVDLNLPFQTQWYKCVHFSKQLKNDITNTTTIYIKEMHATVEYLIAVYGIFIERFLNRMWRLEKFNMDLEKQILESAISYFTIWISKKEL